MRQVRKALERTILLQKIVGGEGWDLHCFFLPNDSRGDKKLQSQYWKESEQGATNNNKVAVKEPKQKIVPNILPDLYTS
jgi:hypothetical protein